MRSCQEMKRRKMTNYTQRDLCKEDITTARGAMDNKDIIKGQERR